MNTQTEEYNLDPVQHDAMERTAQAIWNFARERLVAGDSAEHLIHGLLFAACEIAPGDSECLKAYSLRSFRIVTAALDALFCASDMALRKGRVPAAMPAGAE
jgi:hypothetical protein